MSVKKAVTPLTDEQRKFAEEHADLIWKFIRIRRFGFGDPEEQNDWYCNFAEAYIVAVQKYRPEFGSFANFAYGCMWKRAGNILRSQKCEMRTRFKAVSLSTSTNDGKHTLEDFLPDSDFSTEDIAIRHVYASQRIAQIWPVLTLKHKKTLLARAYYEDAQKEAAKSLNIPTQTYKSRIRCARRRIQEKVPPELQFQRDA